MNVKDRSEKQLLGPTARVRWLAGGGEFASPFFFRRRSLTERLRFDLWSSCFDSQMACDLLVHQFERCRSAESRISLLRGTSLR
jgi:hypothetical protein